MDIAIFTLTSALHDPRATEASTNEFLNKLGLSRDCLMGDDYRTYGSHALDLIYLRTGGTEGGFLELLPRLVSQSSKPFYLLTSGESNSLAASLEILSYLRSQGLRGEVLHGQPEFVRRRIDLLTTVGKALRKLKGMRLGVIGRPSDWLIASQADRELVRQRLGIELVDIGIDELLQAVQATTPPPVTNELKSKAQTAQVVESLGMALRIHKALEQVVSQHGLCGFTLRCFDLLTAVRNTGCLALALLNARGTVAGCEGDVPAMLSMAIGQALVGEPGFQANPSRINPDTGQILLAHCTIPLSMVKRYELDTHFESGLGVGVRGFMAEGPVTIFKVAGNLKRHFAEEGILISNPAYPTLCRTQQVIQLRDQHRMSYFLTDPIGNHHIVLPTHCKAQLDEMLN
ncbi:MAG: hypothetical protein IJT30_11140 [Muribaculaceae bacterium]|nr:hypothetical protein [Muribaculaceae bacterium]